MHSATFGNLLPDNGLKALAGRAGQQVLSAIQKASHKTGVDFAYLLKQASVESSFDPQAQAKTSSARGLYQFIESTWLDMVEKHGHKIGINTEADKRQDLLSLRNDPEIAAFLAAEFAAGNQAYLEQHTNADIGATELYLAHFMGAGGATAFLNAREDNPLTTAADLFPKAAQANRNIFYDQGTGQPRTLEGVYDLFAKKFGEDNKMAKTDKIVAAEAVLPASSSQEYEVPLPYRPVVARPVSPLASGLPYTAQVLDPVAVMLLAELDLPGTGNSKF